MELGWSEMNSKNRVQNSKISFESDLLLFNLSFCLEKFFPTMFLCKLVQTRALVSRYWSFTEKSPTFRTRISCWNTQVRKTLWKEFRSLLLKICGKRGRTFILCGGKSTNRTVLITGEAKKNNKKEDKLFLCYENVKTEMNTLDSEKSFAFCILEFIFQKLSVYRPDCCCRPEVAIMR